MSEGPFEVILSNGDVIRCYAVSESASGVLTLYGPHQELTFSSGGGGSGQIQDVERPDPIRRWTRGRPLAHLSPSSWVAYR